MKSQAFIHFFGAVLIAFVFGLLMGCGAGSSSKGGSAGNAAPVVTVNLSVSQVVINGSVTATASGGTSPYIYSVTSGLGSIDAVTGIFTASGVVDTETIQAQDSQGNIGSTTLLIQPSLSVAPTTVNLGFGGSQNFSASGGIPPYTYAVTSGLGSIDTSGDYTAPVGNTTATITISDSSLPTANQVTATANVSNTLSINPSTLNITLNTGTTFTASGGTPPYTYSVVSGSGILDDGTGSYVCSSGCTGSYMASGSNGTDVIQVTDSLSATANSTITVYTPLSISPTSALVAVNGTQTFTGSGGLGSLTYSIAAGMGSIGSSTGIFTASASAGSVDVRVTDTIGNTADAMVTVSSNLSISPSIVIVSTNSTENFTSILGSTPYTYSITSGGGSIVPATGVYTAPSTAQSASVMVTDAGSNTSSANVTVVSPVKLLSGDYHNCVLFSNGQMRCWGYNAYGQLGQGNTKTLGSAAAQMGNKIPFINLGTGKSVLDFAMGEHHVCALLNDYSVKCWGYNNKGQLGLGNTTNYGSAANQMGDLLPTVNLGTGKTATAIFAGGYSTCAILNDSSLKCWGNNAKGQLGQGNTTNYGSASGQMGDSLPAVSLGTGLTATSLAMTGAVSTNNYESSICAILSDSSLKCWGGNSYGQLGQGNTTILGNSAGQMGNSLPVVSLGTNLTAKAIVGGQTGFCAIIHDSTATFENKVKCWGRNNYGQLGANLSTATIIGSSAGQMGNSLAFVGLANTASKITGSAGAYCALLTDGTTYCWGRNSYGELGQGNTTNYGTNVATMASIPGAISLGTGFNVLQLSVGLYHSCALSTQASGNLIKCWGRNSNGQLGLGNTTQYGSSAGQMGNSLPLVSY